MMSDNGTYTEHDQSCSRDDCPCFEQGERVGMEALAESLEAVSDARDAS
jgi:hypothetical protein